MIDRTHFDAQIERLLRAFPSSRFGKENADLYYERLRGLDSYAFGNGVNHLLDRRRKFPTIADLREAAHSAQPTRRIEERPRESDSMRSGWDEAIPIDVAIHDADGKVVRGLHCPAFYLGEDRASRALSREKGEPCPCMECEYRRERRLIPV